MKRTGVIVAAVLLAANIGNIVSAQEKNYKLNEVVVTATKTEKDPKDITQSVTVLTGEEMRRSGATNVAEAVRTVVGLAVSDQGPVGALTTISLRGSNYAQVLVLLDGIRINSPRDAGVDLSALPVSMDDIDRIEIVRGPGSALYGADAMGGVVNIITKRPEAGYVARVGGAVGSHGYDLLELGTSGKQGVTLYSMSATRVTSDGYRTNSDLDQWTVNGRIGYDLGKAAALDLTANYVSKEIGVPGSTAFPSAHTRQDDRETVLGATYRQKIGKELDVKLTTSLTEDTLQYHDPDYFLGPLSSRHETTGQVSEAQMNWVAAPWSVFTMGYELRRSSLDSTDSGQHAMSNNAWYLQDEIPVGESLILMIGERFDSQSVYGDQWSSRAGGRYHFRGSGTTIRFSYGESYRAPTFNDLYWTDPFGNRGNPNLQPEHAKEYEAGIEQSLGGGSSFKASYFERKVKDLINWQEYAPYQYEPVNIGNATIKGVEAEANLRFSENAVLAMNYTYLNPFDEVTQEKIYSTVSPKNQFKGRLTIAVDTDVYLTVEGRAVENYVRTGTPDWKYSVYDAKIAQKFGQKGKAKGEIYFAMTNIFDRQYENIQGYPMPPKEIRGGITIPF